MSDKQSAFPFGVIFGVIAVIAWLVLSNVTATKCDLCGSSISGSVYKAYGSEYCYSCAHSLFPNATWK